MRPNPQFPQTSFSCSVIEFDVTAKLINLIYLDRNFPQPKRIALYDLFSPTFSSSPKFFWNIREFGANKLIEDY